MIVKQELVKRIKDSFNLNIYETKVWLALTGKGIASAGEIAELSGIPRSRTYDVLESLEKMGFAIAKVGKPVKYLAVKPELVIEKLKNNIVEETKDRLYTLGNIKETKEYQLLEEIHKTGLTPINKKEIISAIKGRSNVYTHAAEMLGNAQKEIVVSLSAQEIKTRTRAFMNLFEKIKRANVKTRIVIHAPDEEIKRINMSFKINAEKSDIKSRFFMIDRKQVLFLVTDSHEEGEEIGIWLDSSFFASGLAHLFETAFKR